MFYCTGGKITLEHEKREPPDDAGGSLQVDTASLLAIQA